MYQPRLLQCQIRLWVRVFQQFHADAQKGVEGIEDDFGSGAFDFLALLAKCGAMSSASEV
jgi:hypothetical protein